MITVDKTAYHLSLAQRGASLRCFEEALFILGKPESMIDFGCGPGQLVIAAAALGITALGFDACLPEEEKVFQLKATGRLIRMDLCLRVFIEPADLVICWEVAEHLPPTCAGLLCDSLIAATTPQGVVLFTAATEGQGGAGHINERPHEYWRELLTECGCLTWDQEMSLQLSERFLRVAPSTPWYGRNIQAFRHE